MNIHRFDNDLETVRIGVLKGIHPGYTYRLALQEKINFQIQDIITALSISDRKSLFKKHINGYTGGYHSLPTIRLEKGNISAFHNGKNIHERALTVEVLKSEQSLIMDLAPKLFPTNSSHPLLLYDMPKDKNIPNAPQMYFTQVQQHQYEIKNTVYIAIHGVDEQMMVCTTQQHDSFLANLLKCQSIKSVEKTTGTPCIGRWLILTSFEHREAVAQYIHQCMDRNFASVKIHPRFQVFPGVNESLKVNAHTTYAQALVRDTTPGDDSAPFMDQRDTPVKPTTTATSYVVTPSTVSQPAASPPSPSLNKPPFSLSASDTAQIRHDERKAMRTEFKDMFANLQQALDDFAEEQVEENWKTRNRYSKHVQILQDQLGKYHNRQEQRITELSIKQEQQATEIKNVDDQVKTLEEELHQLKRAFDIKKQANKWWRQNADHDAGKPVPFSHVEDLDNSQEMIQFTTPTNMDTELPTSSDNDDTPKPKYQPIKTTTSRRFHHWKTKFSPPGRNNPRPLKSSRGILRTLKPLLPWTQLPPRTHRAFRPPSTNHLPERQARNSATTVTYANPVDTATNRCQGFR